MATGALANIVNPPYDCMCCTESLNWHNWLRPCDRPGPSGQLCWTSSSLLLRCSLKVPPHAEPVS